MYVEDSRFRQAVDRFEAAHLEDPRRVGSGENRLPWSLLYHQRLLYWVRQLSPDASEELLLAASCQHIRRWTLPRDQYPQGRSGYRRWRKDLARFHADQAAEILAELGYSTSVVARVQELVQKFRLKLDPEVQTFENAICLVFLENEFADFARKHERSKIQEILRKTWAKMSPAGHEAAQTVISGLTDADRKLAMSALSDGPGV
jgi:hypothetical protein